MKCNNVVRDKSLDFGVRISKMVRIILKRMYPAEHSLCSQILKSGTSIGANIRESEFAESRDDFKHKLKIALKEANETDYWLTILHRAEYLNDKEYNSLNDDCKELIALLVAIIKTSNEK